MSKRVTANRQPDRVREITLRFLAEHTDLNQYGKVHGGRVMEWIDEAGYACAAGWSGRTCVTVYVGSIRFYRPIHIGHIVEVRARLIHTGNTSMHIAVDVRSGDPKQQQFMSTTHCVIVFVALDENGSPVAVPRWQPRTIGDRALQRHAIRLFALGKKAEAELRPHLT